MMRFTLGLLFSCFSLAVQAALTVNIIPAQQTYQLGDTVTLAVMLSDAPPIHGGGLNVHFNPNVLRAQSVVIDNVWSLANRPGIINNAKGSIDDILFTSFNTVEGELGVAIIQLAVVGNGDSSFTVTESKKNPFSDANGNSVSFSVNNLFVFNTQVVEQLPEENSEQVVEQQTTTETTTTTAVPPANEDVVETVAETTAQPVDQVTEQAVAANSTANNSSSIEAFANSVGFSLPGTTANQQQVADGGQNDRQFYLPSGDSTGIPVTVTDDNEVEGQTNNYKYPDATGSDISDNRSGQESEAVDNADESLLASAATASAGENGQPEAGEMQLSADTEKIEAGSSKKLLTFVLIVAVLFIGYIVFKVFIKKEY